MESINAGLHPRTLILSHLPLNGCNATEKSATSDLD